MAMATALLVLLLATPAVYATEYTVGDSSGWTQSYDYSTWASGKTFNVGDTLVFTYGGSHSVDVVSKSDYDNCVSTNALESYSDGNTKYNLTKTGAIYFICPSLGHCSGGMKLAVTVSGSSGTTPSPPSSSDTPPGSPPSTTTPSSDASPPPPSSSTASATLCNMMLVVISLLGFAFMG